MDEQQQRHLEWAARLAAIAQEMRDADFDMQALSEVADDVGSSATRCLQLAS